MLWTSLINSWQYPGFYCSLPSSICTSFHSYLRKFYRFFFRVQLKYTFHAAFSWFLWLKYKKLWHATQYFLQILLMWSLSFDYIWLIFPLLDWGRRGFFARKKFCVCGQIMSSASGVGPKHFLFPTSLLQVWDNEWKKPHAIILWCVVNLHTTE